MTTIDAGAANPRPDQAVQPRLAYMIASPAGAGSDYLCACLRATGVLGQPDAYFQPAIRMIEVAARLGAVSFEDYVARLMPLRTTPNGVFGFSAEYPDLRYLRMVNGLSLIGRQAGSFESGMPVLWFERRDVVAQAAALAHRKQVRNPRTKSGPLYDFRAVTAALGELVTERRGWSEFFTRSKFTPKGFFYEDLVADPAGVAARIQRALGIGPEPTRAGAMPTLTQNLAEVEAAWTEKFRSEAKARGLSLPASAA